MQKGIIMDYSRLSLEEKIQLLAILEANLGMRLTDTNKKEDPITLETRKCNQIAEMKKAGKSIIYTEYQ